MGKLHEQIVNTHLGYLATITSFDLQDFYTLCQMIRGEPDLKSIKYVWVDAICVDQTNYDRRKATIHQMSNIYEKATYILAVPDLHSKHLQNGSMEYSHIMDNMSELGSYMYHLIQGNTEQLIEQDDFFLDVIDVPKDPTLRKLLDNHTSYLASGFTTHQESNHHSDCAEDRLAFLCEIYEASKVSTPHEHFDRINIQTQKERKAHESEDPLDASLLDYDKVANLFLDEPDSRWEQIDRSDKMWTHELMKRGNVIRQAMRLLEDLIVDWSTRVWVISEYHIAKKKNNLKYWFIGPLFDADNDNLPFFKFDFTNPAFFSAVQHTPRWQLSRNREDRNPQLSFHSMMIKQLNTQTFFEMMLKSKASKNEDRFYAILPQSKYRDQVNQVNQWHISTLMSVKLKLFEIMDTKDKWTLLFLAGNKRSSNSYQVLPTFSSSDIHWNRFITSGDHGRYNYDMNNASSAITLYRTNHSHLYYLRLKPKNYYVYDKPYHEYHGSKARKILYNYLDVDKNSRLDIVLLLQYGGETRSLDNTDCWFLGIEVIGSFVENKWTLCDGISCFDHEYFSQHFGDYKHDHGTVFDIY
ncbi:unnamed protein product [Absidia cylindrospora]